MNGQSLSPHIEKFNRLKQIIPEAFSEGKVDWEKLQATLGENINFANERYVLNWAGKSDAFRVMQQPSTRTLVPVREDSVNFDDTQNIFIEGENLEVLKVLQKSYFGKVKMIYIDPPYNTGNDSFIYPDKFSETKEEYQKRVGDKDEDGYMTGEGMFRKNSRENGQYHSNWLNMMMPRLYLARTLLRDDGVIFVSIDDNEVHNLRLLMNEIFGEENFVAQFPWRKRTAKSDVPFGVSQDYEWIICFAKSNFIASIESNGRKYYETADFPDRPWRIHDMTTQRSANERPNCFFTIINPRNGKTYLANPNRVWANNEETFREFYKHDRIVFPGDYDFLNISRPVLRYCKEDDMKKAGDNFGRIAVSTKLPDIVGMSQDGTKEITELLGTKIFSFPKPVNLIKHLINIAINHLSLTTNNYQQDIILDLFAGSATTAHAVMQLNKEDGGNRKYILVQMPELCDEKSEAFKAGYKTIAEIAKERIRRAGKKIREEIEREVEKKKGELNFAADDNQAELQADTGFKVFRLFESNFKQWQQPENYTAEALAGQLKLFIDPVAENADLQNMVYELLLKSGKDLNVKIEDNDGYYLIDGNDLALILEKVEEKLIAEVLCEYPQKVITLDRIFKNNDQLKTNTALQMKDAGVEFKTI